MSRERLFGCIQLREQIDPEIHFIHSLAALRKGLCPLFILRDSGKMVARDRQNCREQFCATEGSPEGVRPRDGPNHLTADTKKRSIRDAVVEQRRPHFARDDRLV
jgi:hypothetical protein